jgi:hypothetical protein
MWTQAQGLALVKAMYAFLQDDACPYYPALTGGLAYKDGPRKDCDIVIYHNRQHALRRKADVIADLKHMPGLKLVRDHGFVTKWTYGGKGVDIMFPEWYVSGHDDYDQDMR